MEEDIPPPPDSDDEKTDAQNDIKAETTNSANGKENGGLAPVAVSYEKVNKSFTHGITKGFNRAKQKLMQAIDTSSKTIDENFEELRRGFDKQFDVLTKLQKQLIKWDESLGSLKSPFTEIGSTLYNFFGEDDHASFGAHMWVASSHFGDHIQEHKERQELARGQLRALLEEMIATKKRVERRDTLLLDHDLWMGKMQEKEAGAEEKYNNAKARYETLNFELKSELKEYISQRNLRFEALFMPVLDAQCRFFIQVKETLNDVANKKEMNEKDKALFKGAAAPTAGKKKKGSVPIMPAEEGKQAHQDKADDGNAENALEAIPEPTSPRLQHLTLKRPKKGGTKAPTRAIAGGSESPTQTAEETTTTTTTTALDEVAESSSSSSSSSSFSGLSGSVPTPALNLLHHATPNRLSQTISSSLIVTPLDPGLASPPPKPNRPNVSQSSQDTNTNTEKKVVASADLSSSGKKLPPGVGGDVRLGLLANAVQNSAVSVSAGKEEAAPATSSSFPSSVEGTKPSALRAIGVGGGGTVGKTGTLGRQLPQPGVHKGSNSPTANVVHVPLVAEVASSSSSNSLVGKGSSNLNSSSSALKNVSFTNQLNPSSSASPSSAAATTERKGSPVNQADHPKITVAGVAGQSGTKAPRKVSVKVSESFPENSFFNQFLFIYFYFLFVWSVH